MTGALVVVGLLAACRPAPAPAADQPEPTRVEVVPTPDGGIQPQAAVDAGGTVHVVYFKGSPPAGDLFYARIGPSEAAFSAPTRVNSQRASAVASGTIRGAQLALGRGGRVHVAWNGSDRAEPRNPFGSTPMLYASLKPGGDGFGPQRNLMAKTSALDGGGSVAADDAGNVHVAWHGLAEGSPEGERNRRVWVARSADDGETFGPERPALDAETGACGCCGTKALADRRGGVYLLYRAATDNVGRDMYLLSSRDRGAHFRGAMIQPWKLDACPMTSASLAESPDGVLAAWETEQQVYYAKVDPETSKLSSPIAPPGGRGRKHPAVAGNARGETILAWAEGTGWQRGGALAWQVFDRAGRPTGPRGRVEGGIPTWGLPAVVARPDGGFLLIH